ncbi:glucokinase [Synechococcus sp. RSCCF101]|uniref:glucokinase n=1 Tax=Synechococcus sp. RSCCF101 TaxID=2511069 RepID=UPI0012443CA4|nr:glucokinase [Synechococcus sp. RSCCF101]QEY31422.1 glucokinase [Synechococcus sp. RSCCF101]
MSTVLAGDLGGTKTLLGLYRAENGRLRQLVRRRYASAEWSSLGPMLADFLAGLPSGSETPSAACLAVAGPVQRGEARITNLPWTLEREALASQAGVAALELVNDFAVLVHGLPHLEPHQQVTLQPPGEAADPAGPVAIIGAGTGLGVARGLPGPDGLEALASEGGHREFAPRNEEEWQLSRWLLRQLDLDRLSTERIASGTGLGWIALWLLDTSPAEHPLRDAALAWRAGIGADGDRPDLPALVSQAADAGDPLAGRALELWLGAYGSAAGDLALHELATGGLWIAGGTAAKQLDRLRSPAFLAPLRTKGRFRPLLEQIPVRVLLEPDAGLFSAACRALRVGH